MFPKFRTCIYGVAVYVYPKPFFVIFDTFKSPNFDVPSLNKNTFTYFRSLCNIVKSYNTFKPFIN